MEECKNTENRLLQKQKESEKSKPSSTISNSDSNSSLQTSTNKGSESNHFSPPWSPQLSFPFNPLPEDNGNNFSSKSGNDSSLEGCFSNAMELSGDDVKSPLGPNFVESAFSCSKSGIASPFPLGDDELPLEQPKKKCKLSQFQENANNFCQSLKTKLQSIAIQACNLKMQRLNVVRAILQNQDNPEALQELKPKHQELLSKEQKLCSEIHLLKSQSTPQPSIPSQSSEPSTLSPTPSISPSPSISTQSSSSSAGVCQAIRRVWSGTMKLNICQSKQDISVAAYAPNLCGSNLSPLFAQFEGKSSGCATTWPSVIPLNGVCSASNLHFFKKYSLKMFVIVPEEGRDNLERFQQFLKQLCKSNWAGVVDLPENTLLFTPFQEKMLAIVLTKMNIALANYSSSPSRTMALQATTKYSEQGELSFEDKLVDGFYDPGRTSQLAPLEEYAKQPLNCIREVLVVDSTIDPKLAFYVQRSQEMLNTFTDVESQARVLALFVSNCFGGDYRSTTSSNEQINKVKQAKGSNVILIGDVSSGVCRHRAILYKYLCDKYGIPCELKRGTYTDDSATGAHAWNVIKLGLQTFVVDIMHEPTQLYCAHSEKAKCYTQEVTSKPKGAAPVFLRPELSHRRFIRLPNLREKAVFHERLGRGNSTVYRITLGGLSCALKKIDIGKMSEQHRQYALQEVQVMEMLQHENIIHYLGHELLEDKKELHILMELFPLSLGQLIEKRRKANQKFTSIEIKHLAIEILNGMDYLHNQKIIHRDLKPDNILVDLDENDQPNKVKITDFGVCKMLNDDKHDQTRVGTELYMAPEQSNRSKQPTYKIDIWSFGIILVELLTLRPAYSDMPKELALQCIRDGVPPNLPEQLPPDEQRIVGIIKSCLSQDPDQRPSADQLVISFFRLQCYGKS